MLGEMASYISLVDGVGKELNSEFQFGLIIFKNCSQHTYTHKEIHLKNIEIKVSVKLARQSTNYKKILRVLIALFIVL